MDRTPTPTIRLAELALTAVIVELTLTTAYVHLTLGGTLFTLNAAGYAALALAVAGTLLPIGLVRRLAWLPRVALAGFTIATIVGYLVIGPYFTLGWATKAIEVAIVTLVVADLVGRYGSPRGLLREMAATLGGRRSMPAA